MLLQKLHHEHLRCLLVTRIVWLKLFLLDLLIQQVVVAIRKLLLKHRKRLYLLLLHFDQVLLGRTLLLWSLLFCWCRLQIHFYQRLLLELIVLLLAHVLFKLSFDLRVQKLKKRLLSKIVIEVVAHLRPLLQPRSLNLGNGYLLKLRKTVVLKAVQTATPDWHLICTEQSILIALQGNPKLVLVRVGKFVLPQRL